MRRGLPRGRRQPRLFLGILLVGWITVEVALLRSFYVPLHGTYLLLGLAISALGLAFYRSASPLVQ